MGMDMQTGHAPGGGLTTAEAQERTGRGEANTAVTGISRSYTNILRTNVFSFYNTICSSSAPRCWPSGGTATRSSAWASGWSTR